MHFFFFFCCGTIFRILQLFTEQIAVNLRFPFKVTFLIVRSFGSETFFTIRFNFYQHSFVAYFFLVWLIAHNFIKSHY